MLYRRGWRGLVALRREFFFYIRLLEHARDVAAAGFAAAFSHLAGLPSRLSGLRILPRRFAVAGLLAGEVCLTQSEYL